MMRERRRGEAPLLRPHCVVKPMQLRVVRQRRTDGPGAIGQWKKQRGRKELPALRPRWNGRIKKRFERRRQRRRVSFSLFTSVLRSLAA